MDRKKRFRTIAIKAGVIACLGMAFTACSITDWRWGNQVVLLSKRGAVDEQTVNRFIQNVRPRQGNPDSHYLLANYYLERGRYQEAIKEFNKVLSIDPHNIKAYNGRGISFDQLGENTKAVEDYRIALSLDAKLDYVLNNLCYSMALQGKSDEAIQACKQALHLNKNNNRIYNNLGMAYAINGDYQQAYTQFETAAGGDKAAAHLKLAVICYERANFQIAADHYRRALLLNPSLEMAKKGLEASRKLLNIVNVADRRQEDAKTGMQQSLPRAATADVHKSIVLDPAQTEAGKRLIPSEAWTRIGGTQQKEMSMKAKTVEIKKVLDGKPLKKVGIEVCNGNGKRYMARDVGAYLNAKGFKVVRLTNADNFNHKGGGEIYYENEYGNVASKIADNIRQIKSLRQTGKMESSRVNVKVILGRDLIAHRQEYKN